MLGWCNFPLKRDMILGVRMGTGNVHYPPRMFGNAQVLQILTVAPHVENDNNYEMMR